MNELEQRVEEVQGLLVEAWGMDSPDELNAKLALLAAARELVEAAKTVVEYIELDLIQVFPGKTYAVEGGEWIKSSGSRREFREHESLLSALANNVCEAWIDDAEKAELIHTIAGCLPASVGWKVTALKELKIDADEFSEWKQGRTTIRFVEDKRMADDAAI